MGKEVMSFTAHQSINPLRVSAGHHQWRMTGFILLGVYGLCVALVVFWPVHIDANQSGEWTKVFLSSGHRQGWLPLWFTYKTLEWVSNVVMFMPGGFLLTLLMRGTSRRWVPLIALAGTTIIESVQRIMPGRTSSVWDIFANTLGGSLGWLCALAFLAVLYRYLRQRKEV